MTRSCNCKATTCRKPHDIRSGITLHRHCRHLSCAYVPIWAENLSEPKRTIARCESIIDGKDSDMWKNIRLRKRCVVVCQGYYVQKTDRGGQRCTFFVRHANHGNLMFLCGLYDRVKINGTTTWSFAIVTKDAIEQFRRLNKRQPVILSTQEALKTWLDAGSLHDYKWEQHLTDLLNANHGETSSIKYYQVEEKVWDIMNDSSSLIEPIKGRGDGIPVMFEQQTSQAMPGQAVAGSSQKRKRSPFPEFESGAGVTSDSRTIGSIPGLEVEEHVNDIKGTKEQVSRTKVVEEAQEKPPSKKPKKVSQKIEAQEKAAKEAIQAPATQEKSAAKEPIPESATQNKPAVRNPAHGMSTREAVSQRVATLAPQDAPQERAAKPKSTPRKGKRFKPDVTSEKITKYFSINRKVQDGASASGSQNV